MAGRRRADRETDKAEESFRGNRLIKPINHLIEKLHHVGTDRDHAGNRKLFFDQYATLLLLYFFTPSLNSLRALQEATGWEKARKKLGIESTSLGSLSEAANIFDASHLEPIIHELAAQAVPLSKGREAEALKGLTAVDGSVFSGMSRMAWALWDKPECQAAKLHLHFDVLKGVPRDAAVTPAACSEPGQLEAMLGPGRLYVVDRGLRRLRAVRQDRRGRLVAGGPGQGQHRVDRRGGTAARRRRQGGRGGPRRDPVATRHVAP